MFIEPNHFPFFILATILFNLTPGVDVVFVASQSINW